MRKFQLELRPMLSKLASLDQSTKSFAKLALEPELAMGVPVATVVDVGRWPRKSARIGWCLLVFVVNQWPSAVAVDALGTSLSWLLLRSFLH